MDKCKQPKKAFLPNAITKVCDFKFSFVGAKGDVFRYRFTWEETVFHNVIWSKRTNSINLRVTDFVFLESQ